jgi:hypothetical protein
VGDGSLIIRLGAMVIVPWLVTAALIILIVRT